MLICFICQGLIKHIKLSSNYINPIREIAIYICDYQSDQKKMREK